MATYNLTSASLEPVVLTRVFFFQAQTGVTTDSRPEAPSNYHWYELPQTIRSTVEAMAERHCLDQEYPRWFLEMIGRLDRPSAPGGG